MEPECSLLHSQVPANCPYTEPARSSHVYDKGTVQFGGTSLCFVTCSIFGGSSCYHLAQSLSWRTTSCQLPATVYLIYSKLPSIWWPFVHPQTADAPCRGDRDPLITDTYHFQPKYFILLFSTWLSLHSVRYTFFFISFLPQYVYCTKLLAAYFCSNQ